MTDLSSAERERQRFEHLVLGAPRPRRPASESRRSKKRAAVPKRLAPGVEERVELRERWSHKQGTPETHEHAAAIASRPGALARLHASGAIDADQLAAAEQIATVHRLLTADVRVRTASLETRIDGGGGRAGDGLEHVGRVRDQRAYELWRRSVGRADLALAMIVDDLPVTIAARRWRMSTRRAGRLLGAALTLWWEARRHAGRADGGAAL